MTSGLNIQILLVEVPVVTGAFFGLFAFLAKQFFNGITARLDKQDEEAHEQSNAMQEHSRALAVLVTESPKIERRLSIAEERITGIRETTAVLRAAVDLIRPKMDLEKD